LSESEQAQARLLAHCATSLAVRQEAQQLLDQGADEAHLHDLRVSCTTSLCGHAMAMERWGAPSLESCHRAQRRVRAAGLVDGALYLAVLYDVGRTAPPPLYLGSGSGLGGLPGDGLAFPPGSGIDPTIRVRRYPPAVQLELWDDDGVSWAELRRLSDAYWASEARR
jgi:hypothetical protein